MNNTLVDFPMDAPGRDDARADAVGLLSRSRPEDLKSALDALGPLPEFSFLRPPETGMVMVRGRVGGSGDPFNLGEMTVTRAVVRTATGEIGVGYVPGRDRQHAERAALADALLQASPWRQRVAEAVIAPLKDAEDSRRELAARRAAATRVEFFTLVRDRKA